MRPNVTLNLVSSAHLLFRTGHHFSSCVPPCNSLPIIFPGKRILSLENTTNRFPRERDFCSFSSPIVLLEAEPHSSRCSFKAHCVLIKDISGCKPFHQKHWLFNFTVVPLFHKEYREFISNHTSESASTYMFLSFGDCIITQSSLIKDTFPFNFCTIIARGFASLYLPWREGNIKNQRCRGLLWFPLNSKTQGVCTEKCWSTPETAESKTPQKNLPVGKWQPSATGAKRNPQAVAVLSLYIAPSLAFLISHWHFVISPHTVNNGLQILTKWTAERIIHPSARLLWAQSYMFCILWLRYSPMCFPSSIKCAKNCHNSPWCQENKI